MLLIHVVIPTHQPFWTFPGSLIWTMDDFFLLPELYATVPALSLQRLNRSIIAHAVGVACYCYVLPRQRKNDLQVITPNCSVQRALLSTLLCSALLSVHLCCIPLWNIMLTLFLSDTHWFCIELRRCDSCFFSATTSADWNLTFSASCSSQSIFPSFSA